MQDHNRKGYGKGKGFAKGKGFVPWDNVGYAAEGWMTHADWAAAVAAVAWTAEAAVAPAAPAAGPA